MAATRPVRRGPRLRVPVARILLLGFFLVFVLIPLYWMLNTSLKPSSDYLAIPPVWWPDEPTLIHYEAALVDGCTRWRAFWTVAVPLAAPGIVAAAVFAFIACWTEFFFALLLTSRYAFTLPTVFRSFIGFQGAQYGEAAALAIVSLGPSIILGVLAQRHLVRGLTLGAVRG